MDSPYMRLSQGFQLVQTLPQRRLGLTRQRKSYQVGQLFRQSGNIGLGPFDEVPKHLLMRIHYSPQYHPGGQVSMVRPSCRKNLTEPAGSPAQQTEKTPA